jgi:hypothetical protein
MHWRRCPFLSMVPGGQLNIGEAVMALPQARIRERANPGNRLGKVRLCTHSSHDLIAQPQWVTGQHFEQ